MFLSSAYHLCAQLSTGLDTHTHTPDSVIFSLFLFPLFNSHPTLTSNSVYVLSVVSLLPFWPTRSLSMWLAAGKTRAPSKATEDVRLLFYNQQLPVENRPELGDIVQQVWDSLTKMSTHGSPLCPRLPCRSF
jgi:hypothetical protein